MICDESIRGVRLLPCAEIIEGRDYVTFNENNLEAVVQSLLENRKLARKIAVNGRKIFKRGYPPEHTANLFERFFKEW